MPLQTWQTLINAYSQSQNQAGSALASSVTLTDVSPAGNAAGQALTLPANWALAGTQLRITANGIFSTTGAPTLLVGIYYGGVAGTALAATAATTTISGATNATWTLNATVRVATLGASASLVTIGRVSGVAAGGIVTMMPATSASGGSATVNTGAASLLTLGAQWGTSSASNTLTVYQYLVELLS